MTDARKPRVGDPTLGWNLRTPLEFLCKAKVVYENADDSRKINHIQNAYANTALNEVMHHAASGKNIYSDRALARALFKVLTKAEQKDHPLPSTDDYLVNSHYFHSILTGRCPAPE